MSKCEVRYFDNFGPHDFVVEFDSLPEAMQWIEDQMQLNYDVFCDMFPDGDVTWLNKLLDCGDTTEIYVTNTDVYCYCTLTYEDDITEMLKKEGA